MNIKVFVQTRRDLHKSVRIFILPIIDLVVMEWIDAMSRSRVAWGFGMSAYQNSGMSRQYNACIAIQAFGHPRVLVDRHAKPPS